MTTSDEKTFNDVVTAVGLLAHGDREKMTPEQIREAGDGVIRAVRGLLAKNDTLLAEREDARNWVRRLTAKERLTRSSSAGGSGAGSPMLSGSTERRCSAWQPKRDARR